jgi:predicted HD superfamily hydrolase involved in NAD metabolism
MEINIENAQLVLKKYLEGTNKYEHSIRVAKISELLAQKWEAVVADAVIAALLHDIGKSMSKQQMLSLCVRNNITIYDFELLENITALHGKISALLFEEEFEGNDSKKIEEISRAISSHVAGDINMNLLDKIIFIADNLDLKEGSRELLKQIELGEVNPDECIEKIIQQKMERNKNAGRIWNPLLDAANKGSEIEM